MSLVQHLLEGFKVKPQIVGVEEGVTMLVGEVIHFLFCCLCRIAQDELIIRLTNGQVATLLVVNSAAAQLGSVGSTRRRKPAGETTVRNGTKIVTVGYRGVLVSSLEQMVEDAGSKQGGVEVAVARRAPLEGGILRPLNRGEGLSVELRLLILQEVEL